MFSALPPEADIRHARWDVRVVPTTEVVAQSTTSSAQPSRAGGISRPSAFAVFRLTYHLGVHGSRCKHFGRCLCETFSRYCDFRAAGTIGKDHVAQDISGDRTTS